jgi:mono/diheme cytochrome c family protein
VVYAQSVKLGPAELNAFHLDSFAIAVGVHAVVSTLVGLLYGAMLPMFPRRPIVLGGLVVPVLWSGMLHPTLNLLNPLLASRIDWFWFIASQVAFGVVAGNGRRSTVADADTRERLVRLARGHRGARGRLQCKERRGPDARSMVLCIGAGCDAAGGLRRSTRPASRGLDRPRLRTMSWNSNCCTPRTAPVAMAPMVAEGRRSRSPIPCTWPSSTKRSMRATIADGVRGTSMAAFAQRAGGMLTEKQIDALVDGIRSRWSRAGALAGANPPSYAATSAGDIHRGAAVYQTFCQSCHGADGRGGPKGSAITNDSFLALTSDQGLRTMVIAGARAGRSRLARIRRRRTSADVGSGSHRRGELARLAPRGRARTAVRRRTISVRSITCRMKLC